MGLAQTAPDAIQLGDITVSGSVRSRAYVWNWFEPAAGENQYAYTGNLIRLNFLRKSPAFDWDVELAAPVLLGLPSTATAAAPQGALGLGSNYYTANSNSRNSAMLFAKQAFIKFKGESDSIQVGRFEFNDGSELVPKNGTLAAVKATRVSQRLIGAFGFSDVGRSFDGMRFSFAKPATDFTFVAATPVRGVFQTDGWGWNRVGFGYAALTHEWGSGRHSADSRVFVIDYDDFRHILKTDNRPTAVRKNDLANIHVQTYGGHSIHSFASKAGTLDAVVWAAVQTGHWGVQKQRAYAYDLEAGFQPKVLPHLKPWLRGGFTYGSGDGNASDGTHGTLFQMLPTSRVYARTPFYNMMNTEDTYGSLMLRPSKKITASSDFHSIRLTDPNDSWYAGGGVFQPWTFGYNGRSTSGRRSLANLYDTSVEYRANQHVTFTGYLGYLQGLASIKQIYPLGTTGQFGYVEVLYRF
jgi:hypothetical protein